GAWGLQRDDWGTGAEGQSLNENGGTDGTGSVHLGQLAANGRIIGAYLWTRTDTTAMNVRLACSTGPSYSVSPGEMTLLGQGSLSDAQGLGVVLFDAVAVTSTSDLWAHYRGNSGGGVR